MPTNAVSDFELFGESGAAAALPVLAATGDGATGFDAACLRSSTAARRTALLADATLAIERRHAEPGLSLHDIARGVATSDRQLQRRLRRSSPAAIPWTSSPPVRMQQGAALLNIDDSFSIPNVRRLPRVGYRQLLRSSPGPSAATTASRPCTFAGAAGRPAGAARG